MLSFLATAGHVGLMGSGARLLLAGVEHATGIPVYSSLRNAAAQAVGDVRSLATPVLAAIGGDQLAQLADPSRQFRTVGDPSRMLVGSTMTMDEWARKNSRRAKAAEAELAAYKAEQAAAETQRVIDEANAKAAAAEQRAAQLDAQLAQARTEAQAAALKKQSRASRRWALATRKFLQRANTAQSRAAENPTESNLAKVMELALKALSTAQAATQPPEDARHILESDAFSPAEKSAAQYSIDAANRDDAYDVEAVVNRLSSDDPTIREAAEDEIQDVADLSGHDHPHGSGHACSCKGTCGACSTKRTALSGPEDHYSYDTSASPSDDGNAYAYDSTEAVIVAGESADGRHWEVDPGRERDHYDYDGGESAAAVVARDQAFMAKLAKLAGPDDDEDCGCAG